MIKALLRIFDWHYSRDPMHQHQPVRAAVLAREYQVKPAAVRQALQALDYQPTKFKSRLNGKTAYREWWYPPGAIIKLPSRGRPEGAFGIVRQIVAARSRQDQHLCQPQS